MKSMFIRLNRHQKVILPHPVCLLWKKPAKGRVASGGKKRPDTKCPIRVNSFFSSRDGLGSLSIRRMTEAQKKTFFLYQEFQTFPVGVPSVFIGKAALRKLVSELCLNLSNAFVIRSLTSGSRTPVYF